MLTKGYDPVRGFQDSKKLRGILNENFPLMIIDTLGKFNVSQILIDDNSSCDNMYLELFEKINLNQRNSLPYEHSNLQAFNRTTNYPRGYMELIVSVGSGKDIQALNFEFLVVPCKSVYKYILGRPFVTQA